MKYTLVFFGIATLIFMWFSLYVKEDYAGNWDFMDLAGMCYGRKKRITVDNTPHFGGIPNSSQVWM